MAEAFRTEALLAALRSATTPTADIDDVFMSFPDYSVAALVGGIELSRRLSQPVAYRAVRPGPVPRALHWPASIAGAVSCPGLQLGPAPARPHDEQVVRVSSEAELDRLTSLLVTEYGRTPQTTDCLCWTLQVAGLNALRWSLDRAAYVGWAVRGEMFELAVGDTGPGIAYVSGAATRTRLALEEILTRVNDRGYPASQLGWMRNHWERDVWNITAYIASGDEMHKFQRYSPSYRQIPGTGPTIVAARF